MTLIDTLSSLFPHTNASERLTSLTLKRAALAGAMQEDELEMSSLQTAKAASDAQRLLEGNDVAGPDKAVVRLGDRVAATKAALFVLDRAIADSEKAVINAKITAQVDAAVAKERQWRRDLTEAATLIAAGAVAAFRMGYRIDTSSMAPSLAEAVRELRDALVADIQITILDSPTESGFETLTSTLKNTGASDVEIQRVVSARVADDRLNDDALALAKRLLAASEL